MIKQKIFQWNLLYTLQLQQIQIQKRMKLLIRINLKYHLSILLHFLQLQISQHLHQRQILVLHLEHQLIQPNHLSQQYQQRRHHPQNLHFLTIQHQHHLVQQQQQQQDLVEFLL